MNHDEFKKNIGQIKKISTVEQTNALQNSLIREVAKKAIKKGKNQIDNNEWDDMWADYDEWSDYND